MHYSIEGMGAKLGKGMATIDASPTDVVSSSYFLSRLLIDRKRRVDGLGPGVKSADDVSYPNFPVAELFSKSTNGNLRVVPSSTHDDDFFVVANVDVVEKSPQSLRRFVLVSMLSNFFQRQWGCMIDDCLSQASLWSLV